VPTDIHFAAPNAVVQVAEDPAQVAEILAGASGLPCRLTAPGGEGDVYVNPGTVAFWTGAGTPQTAAEAQQPAQEPQRRKKHSEPVTDIWGQPLRRKPRRGRDS
jgi:hypothetical protein